MSNKNLPWEVLSTNNHQDFITYADMLKGDKEKYNDNKTNLLPTSKKTLRFYLL